MASKYNFAGEILSCQDNRDLKRQLSPDLLQSIIIRVFYAIFALNLVGSLVDRYLYKMAVKCCAHSDSNRCDSCLRGSLLLLLKYLVCFSISRNWRTFMRKDTIDGPSHWECPISNGGDSRGFNDDSSSGGCADSSKSTTDRSSIREDSYLPSDDLTNSLATQSIDSNKLGQLNVSVQPQHDAFIQLNRSDTSLNHLSGIRLLVILWITIGYSFLYPSANNYQYYRSIINMNITKDSLWFATTNFTLGIDMLLYMTGLVFVYKLAHSGPRIYQLDEKNMIMMEPKLDGTGAVRLIIKKFLRFWPTYLTLIGLAIIVPLASDGPMWPEMVSKRLGLACRLHWWTNLLFINNMFLSESEICLPSSWFVSIMMQLFLAGSLIIVLVRLYSPRVALATLAILLIASCAASFAIAYRMDLRAPVIRMDESFVMDVDDGIFRLYTNFFNNLGPFLLGMAGGFLLIRHKSRSNSSPTNTPKGSRRLTGIMNSSYQIIVAVIILTIAALVLSSVFYKDYSRIGASIYWSLHRVGWAVVTGYLIHNCATGRWKLLNDLLSLSTFLPLSRIIFIAYLVYPIFIHVHSGLVRDGLHVSLYNMLNIYITRLVMTFTTALLIHLLVELPFCSVEEIALSRWINKIRNRSRVSSESSKTHPLLAIAPIVTYQMSDTKVEQTKHEIPILGEEAMQQDSNIKS